MSGNGEGDRWIRHSIHRWDGKHVRWGYSTTLEQVSPEDWHIRVNWRLVDERAVPVGIEVHSSPTAQREADPWTDSDHAKPVTRELFKRLPIGEVIEQGRAQVAAIWEAETSRTAEDPETLRVRAALKQAGDSDTRSDETYRLVAEYYARVKADQRKGLVGSAVAKATKARLELDGRIPEGTTDVRVRKWIAEARRRGYLPPADPRPSKTSGSRPAAGDTDKRK